MSLDTLITKIFEPHKKEIKDYVINYILKEIVDLILENIGDYSMPISREEILEKVIEKMRK